MITDPALETFVTESLELLREMESALLACERGAQDADTINAIFRAAHTIKGSAGLFGLDDIVSFTHVVESILDRVRDHSLPVSPPLTALLLRCCDHMTAVTRAVGVGDPTHTDSLHVAARDLIEQLAPYDRSEPRQIPAAIGMEPTLCADTDAWHISVRFGREVLRNGMDPIAILRYLGTLGSIKAVQTVDDGLPAADKLDPESCYIGFEIAIKSDASKSRIESAFDFVREDCSLRILPPRSSVSDYVSLIESLPESTARLGEMLVACGTLTRHELESSLRAQAQCAGDIQDARPLGELLIDSKLVQPPVVEAALEKQRESRARESKGQNDSRTLRVDGEKLDRLIDLIGELVIAGAATNQTARQVGHSELNESTLRLGRLVEEIRDQALKLRMVQIGATFSRFQRIVRDVALASGKEIVLELLGTETELDKTLIESIVDPLTHLVRNAIDHGIEQPETRLACGKPAHGTLRLNAYHDSSSVVIEVSDDGGGLNRERILSKATQQGLIAEDKILSDREVHALIFEAGFTTADRVTNLSGRGVGMDVVKRNVLALRGSLEIESEEGKGTLIRVRLPLTLAIIDGFLVGVGGSSFVIPLEMVEECVELSDSHRASSHDHHFIALRGAVLPFIRLRELFQVKGPTSRRESIVVVRHAGAQVGIVVDELLGELQAVIKPLSRLFSGVRGIGGSTVLGNGRLALILDVANLVDHSLRSTQTSSALSPPAGAIQAA